MVVVKRLVVRMKGRFGIYGFYRVVFCAVSVLRSGGSDLWLVEFL